MHAHGGMLCAHMRTQQLRAGVHGRHVAHDARHDAVALKRRAVVCYGGLRLGAAAVVVKCHAAGPCGSSGAYGRGWAQVIWGVRRAQGLAGRTGEHGSAARRRAAQPAWRPRWQNAALLHKTAIGAPPTASCIAWPVLPAPPGSQTRKPSSPDLHREQNRPRESRLANTKASIMRCKDVSVSVSQLTTSACGPLDRDTGARAGHCSSPTGALATNRAATHTATYKAKVVQYPQA